MKNIAEDDYPLMINLIDKVNEIGGDINGDIIEYDGKVYFIDINNHILMDCTSRLKKLDMELANNLICPYRKNTINEMSSPTGKIMCTTETYAECYGDKCPYYTPNAYCHCNRVLNERGVKL